MTNFAKDPGGMKDNKIFFFNDTVHVKGKRILPRKSKCAICKQKGEALIVLYCTLFNNTIEKRANKKDAVTDKKSRQ